MNLFYINDNEGAIEIDGFLSEKVSTLDIKNLIPTLAQYNLKFKITGFDSNRLKKNLMDRFIMEKSYSDFSKLFYEGHICIKKKSASKGYNLSQSEVLKKFCIQDDNKIEHIIYLSSMLDGLGGSLGFDSLDHTSKIDRFMSSKYVQINSNGDVFITSHATSDNSILSFILEEIHNRFIC